MSGRGRASVVDERLDGLLTLAAAPRSEPCLTLLPRLLSLVVFAAAFFFRLFSFRFHNDGFHHIAAAHQMTLGGLPGRDFIEDGRILQVVSSFLMLELFGHGLLGELMFSCGALALAAAVTFLMAARASGSIALAVAAATMVIIAVPSLYSYPKVLFPLLGVYFAWCYARRPTSRRLLVAGAFVGVALLYRLDLAAYVAPGGAAIILLRHWRAGLTGLVSKLATYGLGGGLVVAPFLVYLAVVYSVPAYFRDAFEVGSEQSRGAMNNITRLPPVTLRIDPNRLVSVHLPTLEEHALSRPVGVRWSPQVSEQQRRAAEARHGLVDGVHHHTTTWRYYMADYSPAKVKALVEDASVVETEGIATTAEVPAQARVNVRWVATLNAEERAERERRYQLRDGTAIGDRTWQYRLTDTSPANAKAILNDPSVEDTLGLDRDTGRVDQHPAYTVREPRPPPSQRWSLVPLPWWLPDVAILPGAVNRTNTSSWVMLVVRVVPLLVAVLLLVRGALAVVTRRFHSVGFEASSLAGAAVSAALAGPVLMRDHYDRAADVAPLIAVLGAWLIARLWRTRGAWLAPAARWGGVLPTLLVLGRRTIAVALLWFTLAATAEANELAEYLERVEVRPGPGGVNPSAWRFQRFLTQSREPPIATVRADSRVGASALMVYLNECTRPDDYVLVTWFAPETYIFAERRFAGILPTFSHEIFLSPTSQARAARRIAEHAPPIVVYDVENPEKAKAGKDERFDDPRVDPSNVARFYPVIHQYIRENYALNTVTRLDGTGRTYAIWVDPRRPSTGEWGPWRLPCFG